MYHLNLAYEYKLYGLSVPSKVQKRLKDFEYLYFLLAEDLTLFRSECAYESFYFEELRRMGFKVPSIWHGPFESENFWSITNDKKLAEKLNSKIFFQELLNKCDVPTVTKIIGKEKIKSFVSMKNYPLVIKSPYKMSGQGMYVLQDKSVSIEFILKRERSEAYLVEPYFFEKQNVTVLFFNANTISLHISFYNDRGVFVGGMVSSDRDYWKKNLQKYFNKELSKECAGFEKALESLLFELQSSHAELAYPFAVDALFFRNTEGEIAWHFLELNYRKTMGLLLKKMEMLLNSKEQGQLILAPSTAIPAGSIQLSPAKSKYSMALKKFRHLR